MNLSNVIMLEQQPKERMPELWSLCSVSLVLLRKSELFRTVLPSKIFESMAMEKPVILGVQGESADLVMAAGGGICIYPEDAKDLAINVLKLYSDSALRQRLGTNGRRYVSERFDRRALAKAYTQVMQLVCQ